HVVAQAAVVPRVAHDAVVARRGARVHAGVAGPGHRGDVVVVRVAALKALAQQPIEAIGPKVVVKAGEVVGPHLVDHDAD
nr:hypothetical protein [Tanacetum cinerariifolium]